MDLKLDTDTGQIDLIRCNIFVTDKSDGKDKTTYVDELYQFQKKKLGSYSDELINKMEVQIEEIL